MRAASSAPLKTCGPSATRIPAALRRGAHGRRSFFLPRPLLRCWRGFATCRRPRVSRLWRSGCCRSTWFAEQLALARHRRPAGPPAVRRRPSAAVPRAEVAQRPLRAASAAEKKLYREKVLADRARARRLSNDSGLPHAKRGKRCADFERWCEHHSWAACEKCGLLLPRDLTEATLAKDQKARAMLALLRSS